MNVECNADGDKALKKDSECVSHKERRVISETEVVILKPYREWSYINQCGTSSQSD